MNQSCRVCGEAAAGFHFGAFTCEGCKSFFGRTYNNRSSIGECKNNNSCVINKKNRTSCKACRLKKCFFAGMSKQGSRYGRRSNWFKIHCLLQDQQQQQQQHQQQQQQQQHQQTSLPGQERPLDLQQAHLAHNQQIRADSTSLSSALGQLELHQQHHQQLPSPPVGSSPLELAGSRQQQPSSTTSSSSSSSSSSAPATAPAAPTHVDPSLMAIYASFLLQQQQLAQQRAAQQQAQQQQLDNLSQLAHLQGLGKGAELANDVGVPAPQPSDMNATLFNLLQALATVQSTYPQPR